jgi:hypothetical protein
MYQQGLKSNFKKKFTCITALVVNQTFCFWHGRENFFFLLCRQVSTLYDRFQTEIAAWTFDGTKQSFLAEIANQI